MNNKPFLKQILFALTIIIFASCESGFNEIGTEIVGDDDFLFEKATYEVTAFNQNLVVNGSGVQTNYSALNTSVNALGILNNPVFGKTTANFVTQLELASPNPTIDLDLIPVIDSVVLKVPYFSTYQTTTANGEKLYTLDSIYGPSDSKLNLSVYESKYYLRDLDPSTQEAQIYYSNQYNDFNNNKGPMLNTGIDPEAPGDPIAAQNTEFFFNNKGYIETTKNKEGVKTNTDMPPAMRLYMDKPFFQQKFFSSEAAGNFVSNNVFKNYFRGLYFNVQNSGTATTNQALINFKAGIITIYYKEYLTKPKQGSPLPDRVNKTIVLNLRGTSVNLFNNEPTPSYEAGIASPNTTQGDATLYLKGGAGAMNIIELFSKEDLNGLDVYGNIDLGKPNGVSDELDELRANKWLINDAALTFYIKQEAMIGTNPPNEASLEPNRIYLYDLDNNKPLLDYTVDASVRAAEKYNKFNFGGIIEKGTGTDDRGVKYKIKITNHLRNLVQNDTVTNVRLGLVVTESINITSNSNLQTPVFSGQIKKIPTASVMNPLGTILYGNNIQEGEMGYDKRLQLEIHYTKPD